MAMLNENQMFTVPAVTTPEAVALALTNAIMRAEGKVLFPGDEGKSVSRNWILGTYAECLFTIQNPGVSRSKMQQP